jgi:hypothetical protein
LIEIMKFRLESSVPEEAFLRADRALQQGFAYHQSGLLRRTTARDVYGNWIVIDIWRSDADADRCAARWDADPLAQSFMALLDDASTSVERYTQLD